MTPLLRLPFRENALLCHIPKSGAEQLIFEYEKAFSGRVQINGKLLSPSTFSSTHFIFPLSFHFLIPFYSFLLVSEAAAVLSRGGGGGI